MRIPTLGLVLLLAASFLAGPVHATDATTDRSQDRLLRRTTIESRGGRHGEVRILARGPARVVQTVLYSKLLRRVVAEVRDRERAGWPMEGPGREASERYVSALERAESSIPRPRAGEGTDRRRALLIEFVLDPSTEAVLLSEPRLEDSPDGLAILDARPIERLDLPREFVAQDMRLIVEAHFPSEAERVEQLLDLEHPVSADEGEPRKRP